jgi:signal transduction histidine kinase
MLAPCQGRRRHAAGRLAAAAALPALTGCADRPDAYGAWAFAGLALLMVAAGAYALGRLRGRGALAQALREARAGLRQQAQLQAAWLWHTDAEHRLLSWQPPGEPGRASCLLFAAENAELAQRLRAGQAFSGLRLQAAQPLDGARCWELRGLPHHDDLGRFDGFVGSAQPLDEAQRLTSGAAALQPLLGAVGVPALVAIDRGEGWQVQHLNAAAQAHWPQLQAGAPLAAAVATLPAAVQALIDGPGTPAAAAGWRLERFGPLADGCRGLVLARLAAQDTAVAQTGESDTFSFTVSHDLRAPIRVVEGFTRIVKEDYGRLLDRVGNDHLDRVLGAAARMNLMIDALLTLARLSSQPLARQPVNLSQLASYVVDDLRRAAPEREAEVEIEPGLTAQGDPTLLRLVLENLLGNAWKYSARCARAQISLRAVAHGPGRAFVVRDNGAGFDMRSADRLFGLFQRLHSASEFPGHGVGLASVRRIVARHGGEIWAEAEPGRGAAFYFTLEA